MSFQEVTKRTDIAIQVGAATIKGLKTHYGQGSSESPEALINSNGHLEVFLKEGRAANHLGVKVGDPIQVS